jgi:hypothetical protein
MGGSLLFYRGGEENLSLKTERKRTKKKKRNSSPLLNIQRRN